MAHVQLTQDHSNVIPWDGLTVADIPDGDYLLRITTAAVAPSKKGDSHNLNLKCEVLEGPHKGKVVPVSYNIAEERSQSISRLMALFKAVQLPWNNTIDDTQFVGAEFLGHVTTEERMVVDARTGNAAPAKQNRLNDERPHPTWKRPDSKTEQRRKS